MRCNCPKIVKTKSIQCELGDLRLEIPDMEIKHGDRIRICFVQTPKTVDGYNMPVQVKVNGSGYDILHNRTQCGCGVPTKLYQSQLQNTPCGKVKARQYIDVVYSGSLYKFAYVGPCRCLPNPMI